MRFHFRLARTAIVPLGLALLASYAAAQTTPVHVIVSNGMREVVLELKPQCERAIGHPLELEFGTTTGLKQKIDGGEPFDVAILTSEAVEDLVKSGKAAGSPARLARSGIGVGVHAGAPKPDIGTPDALKHTLLNAKFIAYAGDGASRVFIDRMIEKMGIAAEMKPKTMLTQGSVAAGEKVASSDGGLVLTLVSEILPMHGVTLAGAFPAELQNYVSFSAAAGAHAKNPESGNKLIAFLTGPGAAPVYKAKGMEPR